MPGTVWIWAAASDAAAPNAAAITPRREKRFNSRRSKRWLAPILPGCGGFFDRLDRPLDGGVEDAAALLGGCVPGITHHVRIDCERSGRVVQARVLHIAV